MTNLTSSVHSKMSSTGYDAFTSMVNVGPDPSTAVLSTTSHKITASPTAPTSASTMASIDVRRSLLTKKRQPSAIKG